MFCEEIRIKQYLSYISFCPLRILYNSKFIIMATSLGTNYVVVMRVHCISDRICSPLFVEKANQEECYESYNKLMYGMEETESCRLVKK